MSVATALAERTSTALGISTARLKRMVGYGAVGVTGIGVDLSIVEALSLAGAHWLLAVAAGYQVAMTWNFVWQRQLVFKATEGNIVRQYLRYLVVDVSALVVRVATVWLLVDYASPFDALPYIPYPIAAAVPASLVGIALAFLIGFAGTDTVVFGRDA